MANTDVNISKADNLKLIMNEYFDAREEFKHRLPMYVDNIVDSIIHELSDNNYIPPSERSSFWDIGRLSDKIAFNTVESEQHLKFLVQLRKSNYAIDLISDEVMKVADKRNFPLIVKIDRASDMAACISSARSGPRKKISFGLDMSLWNE